MLQEFDNYFRDWVKVACQDWNYPMPSDEYYDKVNKRLPEGLRTLLAFGLNSGIVIPKGWTFTPKGLLSTKGPYQWFSKNRNPKPAPNWEYFVHVAEFVRLHTLTSAKGLSLKFEDDTMDIALYQDDKLIVYYEVKERVSQIQELIKGIRVYQSAVELDAPDHSNDPLRKAKCVVRRKPKCFAGVAVGARFEYRVMYSGDKSFQLVRDIIPLV